VPDISLNVDLKVQQALSELKRLSPGADKEAKAISASLGKALRDAEKEAKKLGDEMGKAGKAGGNGLERAAEASANLGTGGSKALKALGPLGGVLSRISPEAGAAASSIAGLTSAFEGFGIEGGMLTSAVGASLPVLAAGAIAMGSLVGVMDDYTAASKAASAAHSAFAAALAPMDDAIDAARKEQERLNAALDSGSAKKYIQISDLSAIADEKEAEATKGLREEKDRLMQTLAASANMDNFEGQLAQNRIGQIDKEIGAVHQKANELARLSVENYTLRGAIDGASDSEKGQADASKALAAAAKAAKADLSALNAEMERAERAAEANVKGYNSAISALQGMEDQSKHSLAGEMDRIDLDRQAALAKSQALADEASTYASTVSARETIDAQHRATDVAAEAEYQAAKSALQERAASERDALDQQAMADRLQQQQAIGGAFISLGDSIVAATSKQHDTTTREGRRAALAQFSVQKGVMLAQATIAGALAINEALASPAGPPASYIMAAATGAASAVQIGTIAATQPSFHQGYAPDEQSARVLKRESVLTTTATAAVGVGKVRELNAGMTGGGGYQGPAPVILGHRVVDEAIKRELRSSGALSSALSSGRVVGHRTNRRGTTG